jgi:hypothetical protein
LWYMHLRGDSAAAVLAFSSHPNDFPTPARGFRSDSEYAVGVSLLTWCGRNLRVMAACFQNFVTSVKLKPRTFIAGTTMSNDSSPLVRTGVLICSTLDSISIRL